MSLTQKIRSLALEAGFDLFGVTSADPFEEERERLSSWLSRGFAGEMAYLHKNADKRIDPKKILPSAKSILCLGISYCHPYPHSPLLCKEGQGEGVKGTVARYAWGKDYHKVLKKKIGRLKEQIMELAGHGTELKDYTDTGPLLERQAAARAGLGFIGKNTLLLNPKYGSYFFLSEILTNLDLETGVPGKHERPGNTSCGS